METCRRFAAISDKDPLEYWFNRDETLEDLCRWLYWRHVPVKPIEQVLNPESYADYQMALDARNCDDALAILVPAFVAAHPNLPSILNDIKDLRDWRQVTVFARYPWLSVCYRLQEIAGYQVQIDRLGLEALPFSGEGRPQYWFDRVGEPESVIMRDHKTYYLDLNRLAGETRPAMLWALLILSLDGRAIKYTAEYELYLALVLKDNGVDKLAIDTVLSRPVDPAHRSAIAEKAAKRDNTGIPVFAGEE